MLLLFVSRHFRLVGMVAFTTSIRNVMLSGIELPSVALVGDDDDDESAVAVAAGVGGNEDGEDERMPECIAGVLPPLPPSSVLGASDVDKIESMSMMRSPSPSTGSEFV